MYDDVVHNAVHFIKLFELEKFCLAKLLAKRFAFFLFRWLFLFLDASRRQLALALRVGKGRSHQIKHHCVEGRGRKFSK